MIPLYPYSFSVASDRDEVEQWRESYRENIRCQRFLENWETLDAAGKTAVLVSAWRSH